MSAEPRCRVQDRLSAPLLDRIDLQLRVPRLSKAELLGSERGESSASVRERVEDARARQRDRLRGTPWTCNARMPGPLARRLADVTSEAEAALSSAVERFALTGRGFDRAVKVARTLADLGGSARVEAGHVIEALVFRAPSPKDEVAVAG